MIARRVLDDGLNTSNAGFANKVKLGILGKCRNWLVSLADPLVVYELDGSNILVPLSHALPEYRKVFPQYSSNVARIAKHVKAKYPDLTFIDIGANIGDTVAILFNVVRCPVLCIEGDEEFLAILRMNVSQFADVYAEHSFVGSFTGAIKGGIDSRGGTAHLVEDPASGETLHVRTLSDILKTHSLFARSKMIKVDTDGLDSRILRSELEFLGGVKPVVFFEYDPFSFEHYEDDGFKIFESLQEVGYQSIVVFENNGDYLLTAEVTNRPLIEDIHRFYSGRSGRRYCDICAFHKEDSDLCETVRFAEIEFFHDLRCAAARRVPGLQAI